MNRYLTILFLVCFGQIFAQNTFYYQHETPYSNEVYDVVEIDDGYILCGTSDKVGAFNDGFLMKVGKQGDLIWDKIIESEKIEQYRAIIDLTDGFMIGGFKWIEGKRRNLIKKFDFDGNEVWDKIIGDTLTLGLDNLVQDLLLVDGGILMSTSGFDTISNTTNAVLIKLDLNANILWQKNYGSDEAEQRVDLLESTELTEDGYLLKMRSQNMAWNFFSYLIKVDFEGNEIWRKGLRYYQSTTTDSDTVIYFRDFCNYKNDHIVAHFTREDLETYTSNHILIEFDGAGNEVDFREYQPSAANARSDIYSNEDDEIFLIGLQDWDTVGNFLFEMNAAKFDCNKNLLWENHYGTKNNAESQTASTITSDGGVFIGGRILNILSVPAAFNSILVKTDCQGELEWNPESCINANTTQDVLVFPNPFQDQINVHLPNIPKENEIGIQVYDLKGSLVENFYFENSRALQLDLNELSSGFYVVRIFVDGAIYHSEKVIKY